MLFSSNEVEVIKEFILSQIRVDIETFLIRSIRFLVVLDDFSNLSSKDSLSVDSCGSVVVGGRKFLSHLKLVDVLTKHFVHSFS